MFDSGVRGASDVFKALALGAKFVFVGRLWVWGLSIMGETGVRHVMKSLLAEWDILLNVAGYKNVDEINRNAIGKCLKDGLRSHFRVGIANVFTHAESGPKVYTLPPHASKL